MIKTVDTDVLVIALYVQYKLKLKELWLEFGVGKNLRYIPVHQIAEKLGEECLGLPFFHTFSGCDTTSGFNGKGKKSAWEAWNTFNEVDKVFIKLTFSPKYPSNEEFNLLEQFTIHLYDKYSEKLNINDVRQFLFIKKNRSIENIPPTKAALKQHILRCVLQAGFIWGQTLHANFTIPDPSNWGWLKKSNFWTLFWTELPEAAKSCSELIKCACKLCKDNRCGCRKVNLTCTALCLCNGDCQ